METSYTKRIGEEIWTFIIEDGKLSITDGILTRYTTEVDTKTQLLLKFFFQMNSWEKFIKLKETTQNLEISIDYDGIVIPLLLEKFIASPEEEVIFLKKALRNERERITGIEEQLAQLKVGKTNVFAGKTTCKDWIDYGRYDNMSYYVVVKFEKPLERVPYIVTSIHGTGCHWLVNGPSSVYDVSTTGFKVYIRVVEGTITMEQMQEYNWHIVYLGYTD
jgi:hypothetical protein